MFGYRVAELVGQNVSVLFPNAYTGERGRILSDLGEGEMVQHLEAVQQRKDGSEYFISLSVCPIRDLNGAIVGSSMIARDITEKRQRDTKLAALSHQLSHLARVGAIGQMSGAIAHEIGQPLAAITNYASVAKQCLNEATPDLSTARDALTRLGAAAVRAGTIIRGLRDFIEKRPSRAKLDDLNVILQEAIAMTFLGATGDGVQLKLAMTQAAMPVSVDRVQIQQVMHNLMRNGIEAMDNSTTREMFISTGLDGGGHVFFEIRDTGPGVPDAKLGDLFEPFKTTKADGMGVGLSICKTIIEAHGGAIRAQNSPLGGACFHVRIPLASAGKAGMLPT
jgi:two-component system sensor kinase FixL